MPQGGARVFGMRDFDFVIRNSRMLRCAKISQCKRMNPALRKTYKNSLKNIEKFFLLYKTQELSQVFYKT